MIKFWKIKDFFVKFPMDGGAINAVNGVNLSLGKGETLGVVGESGCGKSVTMSTILRLVKTPPARIEGEIYYKGRIFWICRCGILPESGGKRYQ